MFIKILSILVLNLPFFAIVKSEESICNNRFTLEKVRCSGSVEVKNDRDLIKYSKDFGFSKNGYKSLIVNYNISDTKFSELISPCEIDLQNTNITISNSMCISGKNGVNFTKYSKISGKGNLRVESGEEILFSNRDLIEIGNLEAVSINTSSFARIKIDDKVRFKLNSFLIDSNDKSFIGEKVEITATEEVKIFSKYDSDRSFLDNVFLKNGTKVTAPLIEIAANFILGIGQNVLLSSEELILNAKKCIIHPTARLNSNEKIGSCFFNSSPNSLFTVDKIKGPAPLEVKFKSNAKNFYQLYWDFGDGEKTSTKSLEVSHTYKKPGIFTARLYIQDKPGFKLFRRGGYIQINVNEKVNNPPVVKLSCSSKDMNVECNTNGSYDPEGKSLTYVFDFGNGEKIFSVDGNLSYTYKNAGNYNIVVTGADDSGLFSTASQEITVSYPKINPISIFTATSYDFKVGSNINFDAQLSTDPDGTIVKYEWSLGDWTAVVKLEAL